MNKTAFRVALPEFTSTATYPDAMLDFWSAYAESHINSDLFASQFANAVFFATAHYVTLAAADVTAAAAGASPGTGGGLISSKTKGAESVSYDQALTTRVGAYDWNMTKYGRLFDRMVQKYGVGAIVV